MPSVEDIIKEKSDRLESVPASFADNIQSFQKGVYKELISLFDELDIKGGKLVLSKQNLLASAKIIEKLRKVLSGKEYLKIVNSFVSEFDTQTKLSDKYFKEVFEETGDKELLALLLDKNKQDAISLLTGASTEVNFIQPIKSFIDTSITSNASLSETIEGIRTIAIGNGEVNGKLYSYAKQIANDSFAFNDRGYTKAQGDDIGVEWFRYSGGTLDDTREFCAKRVGKYFHRKEIEAWGKLSDWPGRYRNTNSSNIFTVLGGYNCKHDVLPVSLRSVPKEVVMRNIKSGNFIPNDFEKKFLGLAA